MDAALLRVAKAHVMPWRSVPVRELCGCGEPRYHRSTAEPESATVISALLNL